MAQTNGNHKETVAIVGAGLAGLLTAHGLKQVDSLACCASRRDHAS